MPVDPDFSRWQQTLAAKLKGKPDRRPVLSRVHVFRCTCRDPYVPSQEDGRCLALRRQLQR